jgi:Kdo2-lipid IVA lauroyltransferase/acyltransferase
VSWQIWLFKLFGLLPLRINHLLGAGIGSMAAIVSPRYRRMTAANIARYVQARPDIDSNALLQRAHIEQGKAVTELAIAWTAPLERLSALIHPCKDWGIIDEALAAKRPIIFVTPHLGCYEIAGRYVASRVPVTAMYRPPKQAWLDPIMRAGRSRGGATTVPADASGVRALLKTLKVGGAIFILPDQVPAAEKGGEGVWADFLNRPAYTMTLLPRLAISSNALVVFFFAERLPRGGGYRIHLRPMDCDYALDKQQAARQTNFRVEQLIDIAPSQYLWSYNRHKQPAGAPPAPTAPSTH